MSESRYTEFFDILGTTVQANFILGPARPPESPRGYRLPNGEVPGMWDIICGCQLCRRIRGLPECETHPDAPCPECQSNVGCDCEPRF